MKHLLLLLITFSLYANNTCNNLLKKLDNYTDEGKKVFKVLKEYKTEGCNFDFNGEPILYEIARFHRNFRDDVFFEKVVHFIVENGADINNHEKDGHETILHRIKYMENKKIRYRLFRYLIEKGLDIDKVKEDQITYASILSDYSEYVYQEDSIQREEYTQNGSYLGSYNTDEYWHDLDILELLIKNSKNLDIKAYALTKFPISPSNNDKNSVKSSQNIERIQNLFFKEGFNPNLKEESGTTIFSNLFYKDINKTKEGFIKRLIKYGFDINTPIFYNKETLLTFIIREKKKTWFNFIKSLKIDVNTQNRWKQTALMLASKYNNEELFNYILTQSPDVNMKDHNGDSCLMYAVNNNRYYMTKKLIELGADTKPINNKGFNALDMATNHNNKNIQKLIKSGVSGKQTGIDKLLAKKATTPNYNSFALIIGVNKYLNETAVEYADNSAKSFALLSQNVLGIPKENIIMLTNERATSGQIKSNIQLISQLVEEGNKLYFFYAGHGVPGKSGETYILPSDMKADNIELESQLSIKNIYKTFVSSPAKEVLVFMDSCFSGKDDSGSLLYKGVAPILKTKKNIIDKNKLSVFSAGSSSDFANQYVDEEQRLFSYYLMKGMLEGKSNSSELSNYIKINVKRKSLRLGLSYKQIPQYEGKENLIIY